MNETVTMENEKAQSMVKNALYGITRETRKTLADYVQDAYLLSFAKVIAYLGADSGKAQNLLREMDEKTRARVLAKAQDFSRTDKAVVSEAEHILAFCGVSFEPDFQVIKENLLQTDKKFTEETLAQYRSEIAVFKDRLYDFIFDFEDIKTLCDRDIQLLLRETDQKTLALALKGVSAELQEKIFCNVSGRSASMIKDEMKYLDSSSTRDIEHAQSKILQAVFYLADRGEITICSGET